MFHGTNCARLLLYIIEDDAVVQPHGRHNHLVLSREREAGARCAVRRLKGMKRKQGRRDVKEAHATVLAGGGQKFRAIRVERDGRDALRRFSYERRGTVSRQVVDDDVAGSGRHGKMRLDPVERNARRRRLKRLSSHSEPVISI